MQHCTMNGHDIAYDDGIECPACREFYRAERAGLADAEKRGYNLAMEYGVKNDYGIDWHTYREAIAAQSGKE